MIEHLHRKKRAHVSVVALLVSGRKKLEAQESRRKGSQDVVKSSLTETQLSSVCFCRTRRWSDFKKSAEAPIFNPFSKLVLEFRQCLLKIQAPIEKDMLFFLPRSAGCDGVSRFSRVWREIFPSKTLFLFFVHSRQQMVAIDFFRLSYSSDHCGYQIFQHLTSPLSFCNFFPIVC